MQSDSFDLFHTGRDKTSQRTPMWPVEWLIVLVFLVTVGIASGLMFKVSTAADSRSGSNPAETLAHIVSHKAGNSTKTRPQQFGQIMPDVPGVDSCELVP